MSLPCYILNDAAADHAAATMAAGGIDASLARRAAGVMVLLPYISATGSVKRWHKPFLLGAAHNLVGGITLGRHVYLDGRRYLNNWPILVHECVHVAQMLERGVGRFMAGYGVDFLKNLRAGHDSFSAYLELPDELQAQAIEDLAKHNGPPADRPWTRQVQLSR